MDFQAATERMMAVGVSLRELADVCGASYAALRQARLPGDHPNHRSPPPGWRAAFLELARRRGRELRELAEQLEG